MLPVHSTRQEGSAGLCFVDCVIGVELCWLLLVGSVIRCAGNGF